MSASLAEVLQRSRAALRVGDAAEVRRLLADVGSERASGDVLEALAQAAYFELDFTRAAELWERAYAAHRAGGDDVGAVRVARTVACVHLMILGNRAVAHGWLGRARTLLSGVPDSREAGWVALNLGMFEPDRASKEALYRRALEIARGVADRDLEFATLAYLGSSMVHADHVADGMAMLDEALAAVAGDEVDDFIVVEEIFCQLFAACEYACDVRRADEWIGVGEVVARRRNLPAVSAFCRTHYGGVLTAAGRWPDAEEALTAAVQLWSLGRRSSLRAGALVRLADLRVRQGRFEEAEQLLAGLDGDAVAEATRPLAAVHLARGRTELAADVLERGLEALVPDSTAAAPLWAQLVEVHLAAGDVARAREAVDRVSRCADNHPTPYTAALAALSRGQLCLAVDEDACSCLRQALAGFTAAGVPVELARCRLTLARALRSRRPEVASTEARTALAEFVRLGALRDADAATSLLRSLGVSPVVARRPRGGLTAREAEVLVLVGRGLSNPEIAARLYLSRRTVEHHVANILAKLGLRGRAEAAAYAVREIPCGE
ncbi:LuxR C-terminal-related transcriptional regulator [Geodermatophilus sp. SYSU D00742]